jgi:hypothetical protein
MSMTELIERDTDEFDWMASETFHSKLAAAVKAMLTSRTRFYACWSPAVEIFCGVISSSTIRGGGGRWRGVAAFRETARGDKTASRDEIK